MKIKVCIYPKLHITTMTITKKITSAVVAIAFVLTAVLTFAFKSVPTASKGVVAKQWFLYNGTSPAGHNTQSNYTLYTVPGEPQACEGTGMRCAILAEPQTVSGVVRPNLSTIDQPSIKFQAEP